MTAIIEPIMAGLVVSLFNKFILNNTAYISNWCSLSAVTTNHEDTVSDSITTISDISLDAHVHSH